MTVSQGIFYFSNNVMPLIIYVGSPSNFYKDVKIQDDENVSVSRAMAINRPQIVNLFTKYKDIIER